MSRTTVLATLAAIATVSLLATAPAEAGRRTGSWKYSPEEIYAVQEAQREASWREYRHRRWEEEHYGYGRPAYGYGYRREWHQPRYQGWDDEY